MLFERFPTSLKLSNLTDYILPPYSYSVSDEFGYNGIDPITLYYLSKALNITPIIQDFPYESYGFKQKNGTFTGTLATVIYNKTDISFNGRYVKDYEANDNIQFLAIQTFEKVCFLTPKAQRVPRWKAPFLIFTHGVWVLLMLVVVLISCSLYGLQNRNQFNQGKVFSIFYIIIDVTLMLLSAISSKLPKVGKERLIIGGCLIGAWYISGLIQAALTTSISTRIFEKDIDTFEELVNSKLPILSFSK